MQQRRWLAAFGRMLGEQHLLHPIATFPDPSLIATFGLGSLLMRAGWLHNQRYMGQRNRQAGRKNQNSSAGAGAVSLNQALAWTGVQLGLSAVLLFSLEPAAVVFGASSLVSFAVGTVRFHPFDEWSDDLF